MTRSPEGARPTAPPAKRHKLSHIQLRPAAAAATLPPMRTIKPSAGPGNGPGAARAMPAPRNQVPHRRLARPGPEGVRPLVALARAPATLLSAALSARPPPPPPPPLLLLLMLVPLSLNLQRADCLKVTVAIPELVKLNDAFWLNCSHNSPAPGQQHEPQQQQQRFRDVYSISWYKDGQEFYKFEPSVDLRAGKFYATAGVQPDKSKSFEGNLYLAKADVMSEGTYRCEIVAEHSFETVRKSKELKVFALPVRGPRIEILDANGRPKNPKEHEITYDIGDKIVLRCNSNPSKPAARLRWYLNDREVPMPSSGGERNPSGLSRTGAGSGQQQQQSLAPLNGYNVQVTPVEYRNHYRGIYSSHSNLSVVLERDDLVNSRISFKCLASMRQEVIVAGKQLIMLTPQRDGGGGGVDSFGGPAAGRRRARRSLGSDARQQQQQQQHNHHHARHRVQYSRPVALNQTPQAEKAARMLAVLNESRMLNSLAEDARNQLMYIYEDSDSTLGPSIVDTPAALESYLSALVQGAANETVDNEGGAWSGAGRGAGSGVSLETSDRVSSSFNWADNVEFVQMLRDRALRQRAGAGAGGAFGANGPRRMYGPNWKVNSPLYLDENDPLRPIISWPPLDSGKLMLLPAAQTIVAIPTQQPVAGADSQNEIKFVMPPAAAAAAARADSSAAHFGAPRDDYYEPTGTTTTTTTTTTSTADLSASRAILERLIENLNCTCTEGSVDTRLGWLVNERTLSSRDVRLYPTRVSPDHRQTWVSVGLQPLGGVAPPGVAHGHAHTYAGTHNNMNNNMNNNNNQHQHQHQQAPGSLAAILSNYYKLVEAQARLQLGASSPAALRSSPQAAQQTAGHKQQVAGLGNEQLKFACQAEHSMLLYSSSEMITFDFGLSPPPQRPNNEQQLDGNSIEKFSSSSSNVIPAATAYPAKSGASASPTASLVSQWSSQWWPQLQQLLQQQQQLLITTLAVMVTSICMSLAHPNHMVTLHT